MLSRKAARRLWLSWRRPDRRILLCAGIVLGALIVPAAANATFPAWMQHIVGASTVESALYRVMQLPAAQALYPRPPKEAAAELSQLIATNAANAELYQLRAQADEQALDEAAAESDWKLYVAHAPDPIAAKLELADFYGRRLMAPQEIAVLSEVAAAPPIPSETYIDPTEQRSWVAFERILGTIYLQGPAAGANGIHLQRLHRPLSRPARSLRRLLAVSARTAGLASCPICHRAIRPQSPQDKIFPIRAHALLEFSRGNMTPPSLSTIMPSSRSRPAELIQSYFALLDQTHRQRAFVAAAREELQPTPTAPKLSMRSPASSTTTSRRGTSTPRSKPSTPSA